MIKLLIPCLCVFCLTAACSQVRPFVDSRREAGQTEPVGQSTPDRIAVCYNPLWDDPQTVMDLAVQACDGRKKQAQYDTTKYFTCRLATPNTAFYNCR